MSRFIALLFLSLPCAAQLTYTPAAADSALAAGKYREASGILDSLERGGRTSANFYLALGNARFRAGETGGAILAYERGLRLKPGNRKLANNLRYVREEAGIMAAELPDLFLLRWWRELGALLGTTTAYVLSLLFWWLAVAGTTWWLLQRQRMEEKRRFALLPAAFVCVALAATFFFLARSRYAALTDENEAILLAPKATLRVSPTPDGSVEAELEQGHKLYITDRVNRYVKVTLADGRVGYLPVEAVEII